MGHSISSLRRLRAISVGAEVGIHTADPHVLEIIGRLVLRPTLASADEAVLRRYVIDIHAALAEVARVLKPGGKAVYVVGENTIRGTFVRNSVIVAAVAGLSGLSLDERRVRTLPGNRRYLPPPASKRTSAALDGRMRREVVMAFSKPRYIAGQLAPWRTTATGEPKLGGTAAKEEPWNS